MTEIKIEMPLKNFNLNNYTQLARTHWAVSNKAKKDLQSLICWQVKAQINELIATPAKINAVWQSKSSNFDLDNLLLKAILDELQNMELLENDNAKHIQSITHDFEINKNWQGVKLKFIGL
ncbi:hypothetical protein [Mycoplasma sp. P36-A1]|uniref:hypothetical protein n=1 Tax=Mycoplasma sp. P36-A1 TaxID=3252900 RepID=UPI003C2B3DB5